MHLAIYDQTTLLKETSRSVVSAISASGDPGGRTWWVEIEWEAPSQTGSTEIKSVRLGKLMEHLQWWEDSLRDIQILSQRTHLLVFCPADLKTPVIAAFNKYADGAREILPHSMHFPVHLPNAYGGMRYA